MLTGAPGVGKTAILSQLETGIELVAEPARELIAEHRASNGGLAPEWTPDQFVGLLLERSEAKHRAAAILDGPVIFDRAIPDCVAYANHLGGDPTSSAEVAVRHRYHREVLVLRPWAEIYTTDEERIMAFEQTVSFHGHVESAYSAAGYTLVEVPRATLADRVAFVKAFITERTSI